MVIVETTCEEDEEISAVPDSPPPFSMLYGPIKEVRSATTWAHVIQVPCNKPVKKGSRSSDAEGNGKKM